MQDKQPPVLVPDQILVPKRGIILLTSLVMVEWQMVKDEKTNILVPKLLPAKPA